MFKIVILFLIVECLGVQVDDIIKKDNATVNIASSIAENYFTGCTIILQPNNATWKEQLRTFRGLKVFFKNYEFIKSLKIVTFQEYIDRVSYRHNKYRCSKMLHVIYGYDDVIKLQLEQLSLKVNMAGPIWILFVGANTNTEDFLKFVNVPFDAVFLTTNMKNELDRFDLWESYRVTMNHPIRTSHFGLWTPEEGLINDYDYGMYFKRKDLEGIKFRVASLENPPMTMFILKPNGEYDLTGYFAWIWKDLQKILNFTSVYVQPPDYATGYFNGKEWTGMIGMVLKNQIDVIVSEVTMVPERYDVIDFLRPLFVTRYQLFFKEPGFLIQWDGILHPFHTEVWVAIIFSLMGAAVLLKSMHFIGIKFGLEDVQLKTEFRHCQGFFVVISAFLQQGNPFEPKSGTCRIIVLVTYLFSLFVSIAYSGILTSFITVSKPKRPFDSLEEFVEEGTYTMEQIPGTSAYLYFSNTSNPLLKKIYENHFPKIPDSELPQSYRQSMESVCFKHKVTHFGEFDITNIQAQMLTKESGCRFLVFQQPLGMIFLTFVVAKDSPYRKVFDFYLNKMNYQGLLHRFQRKAIPLFSSSGKSGFEPVIGDQVLQMHFILFGGIIAAVAIMIIEIYLKRCHPKIDYNRPRLFQNEFRSEYRII